MARARTDAQGIGVVTSSRTLTLLVFGAFAFAMLVAIWSLPGFLVQDNPLYLYNSQLIVDLLRPESPYHQYLGLDLRPLPYWGAYALLGALTPVLSPRVADQVLMTLTSVGLASMVIWLRWRIAGWRGGGIVAPLVIVLSINILWMYGLHSFLLGGILYCVTLAYWWHNRESLKAGHIAVLAAMLVAGYFCHLVSFGCTAIGIVVLALATPSPDFGRRLKRTALSLVPTVPLVILYFQLMGSSGDSSLQWRGLTNFWSPAAWLTYLFMADFPAIHEGIRGVGNPFMELLYNLPPPSRWALIGLSFLAGDAVLHRADEDRMFYRLHRGWIGVAAVLIVGGAFGPTEVGLAQGSLRERVLLLGFATIIPILRVNRNQAFTKAGFGLLMLAAIAQVTLFWDYALKSDRLVGEFMKSAPAVGRDRRVAAVVEVRQWPYRTSPLIHAPSLLGLNTGNLIWNNHAPALFFFPVKYRTTEFSQLALRVGDRRYYDGSLPPEDRDAARDAFRAMLAQGHRSIDVLVLWTQAPELYADSKQWFDPEPIYSSEYMRVLKHLPDSARVSRNTSVER